MKLPVAVQLYSVRDEMETDFEGTVRKMKELGYYNGTVTGEYRGGTQKAVKAYQRDKGLNADGIAGTNTLSYLYNDAKNQPTPTLIPTPTPTPTQIPTPSPTITVTVDPD